MPNFTFTGPQGQQITVTGPDGSTPEQAFAIMQQHMGGNPAQTKVPGYQASDTGQFTPIQNAGQQAQAPTGNAALGALQGLSNAALGAGNAISAGAYATLKPHANMGEASQNFDAAIQFLQGNQIGPSQDVNTEAARQAVQGAAQTMAGAPQALYDTGVNKLNSLAQKLPWAPAMNQFINQHPALQKIMAATQGVGDVAANTLLPAIAGKTAGAARVGIDAATADTPFSTARQLNLSIPPSFARLAGGKATISPTIEGMVGGAPKTAVEASVKNAPAINAAAAADVPTFEKGATINDENLDAAAQPEYAKYQAVRNLGKTIPIDGQFKKGVADIGNESADAFPMDSSPALDKLKQAYLQPDSFGSNGAVLKIRQLRKDGQLNINSMDPEKMQLGYAQKKIAGLIEDQMDRYASSRPEGFDNPNLISDFRQARQNIAKIETLRDALLPGTSDVSAARLFAMKKRGVPLSGNMDKIADLYGNFKPAMQDALPLRNKVPVNRLEGMLGGAGMGASIAEKSPTGMLATAGYLLAPPLARKAMLSNAFQNSMLPKAPLDPALMRILMGGAPAALNAQNQGNQ